MPRRYHNQRRNYLLPRRGAHGPSVRRPQQPSAAHSRPAPAREEPVSRCSGARAGDRLPNANPTCRAPAHGPVGRWSPPAAARRPLCASFTAVVGALAAKAGRGLGRRACASPVPAALRRRSCACGAHAVPTARLGRFSAPFLNPLSHRRRTSPRVRREWRTHFFQFCYQNQYAVR